MTQQYQIQPCFPFGKRKALTFGFDDGKTADRKLVRVLNKYRMRGTFYLNSANMLEVNDGPEEEFFGSYLPKKDILTLYSKHEVASHTGTHPHLTALSDEEIREEILSDRATLEQLTKGLVNGFSYPFGEVDDRLKELVRECKILYARTTRDTGDFLLPKDLYEWNPTCHYEQAGQYVKDFIQAGEEELQLFYIWGHSYEIDAHEKWGYLQTLLDSLSGNNHVWYATNKEIAKYLKALDSLEISVNGKIIYNPSIEDIWCLIDGRIVEISSDEYFEIR